MALAYSALTKPANSQVVDPSTGRMREEWQLYFDRLTARLNAAVGSGDVFGPVSSVDGNLASFDGTGGTTLQDSGIASSEVLVDGDIGTAVQAYSANLDGWSGEDPDDYSTTAEAGALYQPLDGDLTALAALASTGMLARTGAATYALRALTAGAGISITNGNGVSGNPTIATTGGSLTINVQTFTSSGTYTPTSGMVYCRIRVQAPGGGGGGADGVGESGAELGVASGGGGGGEYAEGVFAAATIGASQTVTIGPVGTAGSNTGGDAGNGGNVSVGALISANGGSGGTGTGSNSTSSEALRPGGNGGTGGSGGYLRIPGEGGDPGLCMHASNGASERGIRVGGKGGAGQLGFGGKATMATGAGADVAGNAGQNYGGGGSGAVENDTTGSVGGAGGAGTIIIEEFIL